MRIPINIHASWQNHLIPLFNLPSMIELNTEILPKCQFYPQSQDIFNVFKMPLNEVNVVILGQDPYPKSGQAIGYSFAVSELTAIPKSLKIIQTEVLNNFMSDEGVVDRFNRKSWRELYHWRQQGVFLLNTALTVERERAGSHIKLWKPFTNEVIRLLATQNPIWILWGNYAIAYEFLIRNYTKEPPVILKAAHPAVENYSDKGGFYGCNHFKQANESLELKGKKIITW